MKRRALFHFQSIYLYQADRVVGEFFPLVISFDMVAMF